MATNAILGWPSVSSAFALSGGAWQPTYPVTQLQSLPLSYVGRTVDLDPTHTVILATATQPQRVSLLALARHNMTIDASARIRLWGDAARTELLYDSGVNPVWPEAYPYSTLEWEDDEYWTGRYTNAELEGSIWLWLWWSGVGDYNVMAIEIDLSDPTNPAGYVQAGYLSIAAKFEVSFQFQYAAQYGFRYRTTSVETIGGGKYFDTRLKPKVFKGQFLSPRDEALAKHLEMRRQLDLNLPVIWVPHPDEPEHWNRTAMLAQFVDPGLFAYTQLDYDTVSVSLEEIIG